MRDLTGVFVMLGVALALSGVLPAAGQAFTVDPGSPLTGETVNFSTPPEEGVSYEWDLTGNGRPDESGASVSTRYMTTGTYTVTLRRFSGADLIGSEAQDVQVGQLPAPFIFFPSAPQAGQEVLLVYTSPTSPPVPIKAYAWDLNGDGLYGDRTGPATVRTFPVAGSYPIGLRVTNADDAFGSQVQTVNVLPAGQVGTSGNALRLLSPFPVVRITGRVTGKGTRIRRLTVVAPVGARVRVRCHGRGCPFKSTIRTVKQRPSRSGRAPSAAPLRIRRLERRLLRGGATLRVSVTAAGTVGKFTRFQIRSRKSPKRTDLCLVPNAVAPAPCPSS